LVIACWAEPLASALGRLVHFVDADLGALDALLRLLDLGREVVHFRVDLADLAGNVLLGGAARDDEAGQQARHNETSH
jgi:hypothetical protein